MGGHFVSPNIGVVSVPPGYDGGEDKGVFMPRMFVQNT